MRNCVVVGSVLAALFPAAARAQQDWPVSGDPRYERSSIAKPTVVAASVQGFGRKGGLVISSDTQFVFEYLTTLPVGNVSSESHSEAVFTPTLQYFVANHLAIGLMGIVVHDGTKGVERTAFGGGPVVGFNVAIRREKLSLFPQLAVPYLVDSPKNGATVYSLGIDTYAPFVWQLAPHFFLGLGPAFRLDLIRKREGSDVDKTRALGARLVVGGYL